MSAPATRPTASTETGPPADDGVKLATISRGPHRELRVRWRTYEGHPFLDVREWSLNEHTGAWWPTKGKGVTVKARELAQVADAIAAARTLATDA